MPAEPARTAVTGAQGSNPGLPEPGFGGSYVNTPAAWRNGAVGAISIAVGPRSSDPGDPRSTHLPLASTTHSADARPATPVTIGIASAATRSVPRTVMEPRSTPNRRVPTRTGRTRVRQGRVSHQRQTRYAGSSRLALLTVEGGRVQKYRVAGGDSDEQVRPCRVA